MFDSGLILAWSWHSERFPPGGIILWLVDEEWRWLWLQVFWLLDNVFWLRRCIWVTHTFFSWWLSSVDLVRKTSDRDRGDVSFHVNLRCLSLSFILIRVFFVAEYSLVLVVAPIHRLWLWCQLSSLSSSDWPFFSLSLFMVLSSDCLLLSTTILIIFTTADCVDLCNMN